MDNGTQILRVKKNVDLSANIEYVISYRIPAVCHHLPQTSLS